MSTTQAGAKPTRAELSISLTLVALMMIQAALGLLFPESYRDVEWIRATWFGNDLVTLCLVVPMIVGALWFMHGGSPRARLVWLGTLGYGAYNYAYYLLGAALNAFFPIYVLALVTSVAALILGLTGSNARTLAAGFSARTPVRIVGGFYVFIAVGLSVIWFGMWAAYIFAGRPTPIDTEAFKLVAALDTTVMVPALVLGGVLLWRRNRWGYVLASAAGIQAALYLFVLTLNSAVAIARGIVAAPGELPMWGTLLVPTAAATIVLLMGSAAMPGTRTVPQELPDNASGR